MTTSILILRDIKMFKKRDWSGGAGCPVQCFQDKPGFAPKIFGLKSLERASLFLLGFAAFYVFYFVMLSNQLCPRSNNVGDIIAHDLVLRSDHHYISDTPREPTSLDHVAFCIGSSATQWNTRKQYVDMWWQPGKTRGFVWLDSPTEEPWSPTSPPYRISEDTSAFNNTHPEGSHSAIRIARIVSETFRLGLPNVRWFVMGDDDTVFFIENLLQVLSKYDHTQYYYIGSNSESSQQNMAHTYAMAFGGGGFAISYPLAKALEKIQDNCLHRYPDLYGSDHRIQACLAELGVPLTREPGFHQIDLHGSIHGLLTAHPIVPLVSLHHLDSVSPIFPTKTQADGLQHLMEAVRIDPSRVLQQSICYDKRRNWTISVSWGYCMQIYDTIQLPRLMEYPLRTFFTWSYFEFLPFMFNTRPFTPNSCDRPTELYMDTVKYNSSQLRVVSNYTREEFITPDQSCSLQKIKTNAIETIRLVSDKMSPHIWKQAPRRQCCDIVSSDEDFMEINIRSCGDEEAIFPQS